MRFSITKEEEQEAEVQMAPLIDCVFILLIFFLLTSILQKPHKDYGIILPDASSSKEKTAKYNTIIVEITAPKPPQNEPIIVLDGSEVNQTLLLTRLREIAYRDPVREIRIDADRNVPIPHIVRVMDILQFLGFNKIGIRTRD